MFLYSLEETIDPVPVPSSDWAQHNCMSFFFFVGIAVISVASIAACWRRVKKQGQTLVNALVRRFLTIINQRGCERWVLTMNPNIRDSTEEESEGSWVNREEREGGGKSLRSENMKLKCQAPEEGPGRALNKNLALHPRTGSISWRRAQSPRHGRTKPPGTRTFPQSLRATHSWTWRRPKMSSCTGGDTCCGVIITHNNLMHLAGRDYHLSNPAVH